MSDHPAMLFYFGDFVGDTLHLSLRELGAYVLLIGHMWNTGALPDDDRQLARICRCDVRTWRIALRPRLEPFFEPGWHHKRVADEIQKLRKKSGKMLALRQAKSLKTLERASLTKALNQTNKNLTSSSLQNMPTRQRGRARPSGYEFPYRQKNGKGSQKEK